MAVAAIRIDEGVARRVVYGSNTYRYSFLTRVKVTEATNLLAGLLVFDKGLLFEPADEHHHPKAVALDLAVGADGGFSFGSRRGWGNGHVLAPARLSSL
jgi:hypothetical protein